jgi:hypothetical protein
MQTRSPALAAFAFAVAAPLCAQVSPSMDSPNTPTGAPLEQTHDADAADQDQSAVTTFRTGTNLVQVFFTVRDKAGTPDPTLTQGDCTVLEDKQPRPLKSFGLVRDQPLTLGVLLDTSGSQQTLLPMEKESGKDFLRLTSTPTLLPITPAV